MKIHEIVEDKNDFHPRQAMGRRKACRPKKKSPAKTSRAAIKRNPGCRMAAYGKGGHSSYWD